MGTPLPNDPVKKRLLDFSACTTAGEVHQLIREELELPAWYGGNLDALWDSLTGIMYTPADITIRYRPRTKAAEGLKEYIHSVIAVFEEAREKEEITLTLEL